MKSFFQYKFNIDSLEDLLIFISKTPNERATCISILLALPHFYKSKNELIIVLPWSYNSLIFTDNPFSPYIPELFITSQEDKRILEFLISYICIPVEDPNIEKWVVETLDFRKADFYKCHTWVTVMITIYKQDPIIERLKQAFLVSAGNEYSPYKKLLYFSDLYHHERFYHDPLFRHNVDPKNTYILEYPYPFTQDWQECYFHQLHFKDDDEKNGGGPPSLEWEPGQ